MSLADEYDVDVELYHRDGTIYIDTRTSAPEQLLVLLDDLGLERHGGRGEIWHQVPAQMDEIAMKDMADRAMPLLSGHGYQVSIDAGLFGGTAYRAALAASQTRAPTPAPVAAAPPAPYALTTHRAGPRTGPAPPSPGVPVTRDTDRRPPPITADRKPRLATALFRRYLRAITTGSRTRTNPLAGGRPEAALDEARSRDMFLLVDSYRIHHHD
ncbi:hypothetical protein ACH47Z_28285 [Streptomyces sp. NPDC020192]|uniref:hypothetical protein n=1 Tax=Streptomyces sp. NPDC020192 TaxID=3365066 RepID=UPI0037A12C49